MKLPFKLSMPKFGRRAKPSDEDEDDEEFGYDTAAIEDDEDAALAVAQTIILDDPDADDDELEEATDPDFAALGPEDGEPVDVDDAISAEADDSDDDDDDDDEIPEFEDDFDDNDDSDDDSEGPSHRVLAMALAAGVAGLSLAGGGAWWWLASGDEDAVPATASLAAATGTASVSMAFPSAPTSLNNLAGGAGAPAGQPVPAGALGVLPGALSPPTAAITPHGAGNVAGAAALGQGMAEQASSNPGPMDATAPGETMPASAEGGGGHDMSSDAPSDPGAPAPMSLNAVADASQDIGAGIVVASVSPQAFAGLPPPAPASPLPPVPDPGLIEAGENGRLPRVDGDGRRPSQIYARPFVPPEGREKLPRIAILIGGLGLSEAATEAAIRNLPGVVSLLFDPYGKDLDKWVPQVREAGHEFLIGMPMEPANFPVTDPGPLGLMTTLEPADLRLRIDQIFGRMAGYVGIVGLYGTRYMTEEKDVTPVLTAMKWRGLIFVDASGSSDSVGPIYAEKINLPMASVKVVLDAEPTAHHIDAQLAKLEQEARAGMSAVGLGSPYPRTLERLLAWAEGLEERGFLLVPVTAVVKGKEK